MVEQTSILIFFPLQPQAPLAPPETCLYLINAGVKLLPPVMYGMPREHGCTGVAMQDADLAGDFMN
ncbi:MAG: hypothetical protein ABW185_27025 [Sedimenticola sp.]